MAGSSRFCWLKDPLDLLAIQIEGSGRVILEDGTPLRVNYDSHNGYPFSSISRVLIERKLIPRAEMSTQRMRDWMAAHPDEAAKVRAANRSYVFFRITGLSNAGEPVGAQGVPLTPGRSIAVDRRHEYGTPFFIEADLPIGGAKPVSPFRRLMIAQDTGSAIVGPARADLYWGAGDDAGRIANRIRHAGKFVMLIPRELDMVEAGRHMPLPAPKPKSAAVVEVATLDKGKSLDKSKVIDKSKSLDKGKVVDKGKALDKSKSLDKSKVVDKGKVETVGFGQDRRVAPKSGRGAAAQAEAPAPDCGKRPAATCARAAGKPASAAAAKPASTAASKPTSKPASAAATKPASTAAGKPTSKPASAAATKPASTAASKPTSKPASAAATKPASTAAGKPTSKPAHKPASTAASKPASTAAGKPAGKPANMAATVSSRLRHAN